MKTITKPTITQLDKKLWKLFSEYIRRRDADENGFVKCFTCGKVNHWKKMDAGHGIGRQHKSTKFDEKNSQPQCGRCNCFEGGMRERFKENMDKKYGPGTWDLMELKSRTPSKWGVFEYETLIKFYKSKLEEMG